MPKRVRRSSIGAALEMAERRLELAAVERRDAQRVVPDEGTPDRPWRPRWRACARLPGADLIEKRFDQRGLDVHKLRGIGTLAGQRDGNLEIGDVVHKVGRTTGVRHGRVTAFELDGVAVEYDIGVLTFDDQVEIEGSGTRSFSDAGDSGSLIVDDDMKGAALLFAGGDHGGSNGKGLTYGNPFAAVTRALKVTLA